MHNTYSMDSLDKGIFHIPGRRQQEGARFHHATQNLKIYEFSVSGIFHLVLSDQGLPCVAETTEGRPVDKGGLLYSLLWHK